jgi:hypothetical protein
MEFRDLTDKPENTSQDSLEKPALERRLQEARPARPGTFRYSDAELGGEVRTSVGREGGVHAIAQAEVFRPDGTSETVGTARYSISGGDATLDSTHFVAPNYGTESALLSEVSKQAREQGASRLRVWVADDDPGSAQRWQSHGFQPTERAPQAAGTHWERPV